YLKHLEELVIGGHDRFDEPSLDELLRIVGPNLRSLKANALVPSVPLDECTDNEESDPEEDEETDKEVDNKADKETDEEDAKLASSNTVVL
ncbi:hypothetical protein SEUCBS139899_008949, partial [Sporothrix eucalyptigena]